MHAALAVIASRLRPSACSFDRRVQNVLARGMIAKGEIYEEQ